MVIFMNPLVMVLYTLMRWTVSLVLPSELLLPT